MEVSKGFFVYKKRPRKPRLEDVEQENSETPLTNGAEVYELEKPSVSEEPDKDQAVDAPGFGMEKASKEGDEADKNLNRTAEIDMDSERHEAVEDLAAAKPNKPLLGFQRRHKRQRPNEENGARSPPKAKATTGNSEKADQVSEDDDEQLKTTRDRRTAKEDDLDFDQEDFSEDDFGSAKKMKGKKLPRETGKINRGSAKRLKHSAAKASSKKMMNNFAAAAVNTSEDLSIHRTVQVQERGPSSGLSEAVYQWLNELGLLQYAEHFETHEVDEGVLPLLTFEDLREMGICAVGTRRKMFTSIQAMGKQVVQGD